MPYDRRIRRAAGVIMWYLHRGVDSETAVLTAQEREPELEDIDIRDALRLALRGLNFARICKQAPRDTPMADLIRRAGLECPHG